LLDALAISSGEIPTAPGLPRGKEKGQERRSEGCEPSQLTLRPLDETEPGETVLAIERLPVWSYTSGVWLTTAIKLA